MVESTTTICRECGERFVLTRRHGRNSGRRRPGRSKASRMTARRSKQLSADGFLYTRCVCVANGKRFYDDVRAEPKRLPRDLEFEALLDVAARAYERKTGREFEYQTGCSYETYSNVRGWSSRKSKTRAPNMS